MPDVAELIVDPDAETVLVDYLAGELSGRPDYATALVATRKPATMPPLMVRIMRTGGPRADLVQDAPQLTVDAYGETEEDASGLATICRALIQAGALQGYMGATPIGTVREFSGPSNMPDPQTSRIRYTATYVVQMRGTAQQ